MLLAVNVPATIAWSVGAIILIAFAIYCIRGRRKTEQQQAHTEGEWLRELQRQEHNFLTLLYLVGFDINKISNQWEILPEPVRESIRIKIPDYLSECIIGAKTLLNVLRCSKEYGYVIPPEMAETYARACITGEAHEGVSYELAIWVWKDGEIPPDLLALMLNEDEFRAVDARPLDKEQMATLIAAKGDIQCLKSLFGDDDIPPEHLNACLVAALEQGRHEHAQECRRELGDWKGVIEATGDNPREALDELLASATWAPDDAIELIAKRIASFGSFRHLDQLYNTYNEADDAEDDRPYQRPPEEHLRTCLAFNVSKLERGYEYESNAVHCCIALQDWAEGLALLPRLKHKATRGMLLEELHANGKEIPPYVPAPAGAT